ncbi:MAG: CHC2 zinc finger domain-containing protein [Methylacidiphilales bacterium]|nr:CHC2 zinc finger domain-containing protein [Candidatus Methylacidiphilales bacterium]
MAENIDLNDLKRSCSITSLAYQYSSLVKNRMCRCICGERRDTHPSVSLNEENGLFYCFICNKGGSALDFIMMAKKCTFKEAVQVLKEFVEKNGRKEDYIPLHRQETEEDEITDEKTSLILRDAITLMHENLKRDKKYNAMDYLLMRGFNPITIDKFKIGFSYMSRDFVNLMLSRFNHAPADVLKAGLVNSHWDPFLKHRIVFPIYEKENVVYLIGRSIRDNQQPKYLGLPTSSSVKMPLFIGSENDPYVLIVEGTVDAYAAWQSGIYANGFSIAALLGLPSGKSFKHLERNGVFKKRGFIMLDSDAAGITSMSTLIDAFNKQGIKPAIIVSNKAIQQFQNDKILAQFKHKEFDVIRLPMEFKDLGDIMKDKKLDEFARFMEIRSKKIYDNSYAL